MVAPILTTKLYAPPPRPNVVLRPRLIEQLNVGLARKLTLISAPAGYGKTTLVSEWLQSLRRAERAMRGQEATPPALVAGVPPAVAWLSLDPEDNDPSRFLLYLVAALQTVAVQVGQGVLAALSVPQPPARETILTNLLNELITLPGPFTLVLDDYHLIDAQAVDHALTFLIEHLPPQMHLVIATREDPQLPLARLRARGQLTELRAADLRFTPVEAAAFLNQSMGLRLTTDEIAALESRTEGWIAGLQLAALSLQRQQEMGQQESRGFIRSFTGSHRFVLDYLVEEVLQHQPENIQNFLLRTAILNRLCGPLCDALLLDPATPGQATLEALEEANLFLIPLDNERHWYRYHHLFAELLQQRLGQWCAATGEATTRLNELHLRASQWYEAHDLALEAFHHAAAANDVARAERLADGRGIPLHLQGGVTPILQWLAGLPTAVLNARPSLWWRHAALLLINGQTIGVAEKLDAADAALQGVELDDRTRNLVGQIATARATLALTRYDVATMLTQARRALEYLAAESLFTRASANWTLGFAHFLAGERVAARQAYWEAIALSQRTGATFTAMLATIGLGNVQEADNQLHRAAETYAGILPLVGDKPQQIIHDVHLGLARLHYEWNDLAAAEQHGRQGLHLARQYEKVIDRFIVCEIFLARLQLARGDVAEASAMLAATEQQARQLNFAHRFPEIAAARVLVLLRQGQLAEAAQLAQLHDLALCQARVQLAQGDAPAALARLTPLHHRAETHGWADERLRLLVLRALAHQAQGDQKAALQLLEEALALAEPEGYIRLFLDEGQPMAHLLSAAAGQGLRPDYVGRLLAAFAAEEHWPPASQRTNADPPLVAAKQSLIEPLSQRELEILQLIAQGFSNQEICTRLFLALSTVKGHNQRIFDKLQVQRRTEAVARARALGLV